MKETGLSSDYRLAVVEYKKIVEARRKWAHESENEFARLLLSEQFQDPLQNSEHNTPYWTKLLLWTYNKETLQEMAAVVANV